MAADESAAAADPAARRSSHARALLIALGVAVLLWVPRFAGPLDLRWDGAVYFILGTSLAEGHGYRLLNEPGDPADVQYPPLLPAIVAAHQLALGTNDPTTVGRVLRWSSFLAFLAYAVVLTRFLRAYLSPRDVVLAALLTLLCLHTWYLSDLLFPEVPFSVATVSFLVLARRQGGPVRTAFTYLSALASYALRTIGIAAFAVWVLDSLVRRRVRQALFRTALALLPMLAWQGYVAAVERSDEYTHPAYAYQRAPYLFYNVSYARNVALRDPFTPEKGPVLIFRRVARNALDLPVNLGGTLSASRGYLGMAVHAAVGDEGLTRTLLDGSIFWVLSLFGAMLVVGGLALLLARHEWLVPLYVVVYLAALCLTPFPEQFLRYLMPIQALLVLSAIVCVRGVARAAAGRPGRAWALARRAPLLVLVPALLMQVAVAIQVYGREHQPIAYVDARGEPLAYRAFFYDEGQRGYDEAADYVRTHAGPKDIVAAGMPHWIHLRTGLETVMPPFERDAARAERLLEGVPVRFLLIGRDVIASERYTRPVVERFPDRWEPVYVTRVGGWRVYRSIQRR